MSIIYGTLERLETENQAPATAKPEANTIRKKSRSTASLVRTGAITLLLFLAGANLTLWYWSNKTVNPLSILSAPVVAPVDTEISAPPPDVKARDITSTAAVVEEDTQAVTPDPVKYSAAEVNTPNSQGTEQAAITHVQTAEASSPESREAPSPEPRTSDPVIQARVEPTDHPARNLEPRPVEARAPEPAYIQPATQPASVDDIVDEARRALSRGSYQRALSVLHALEPMPDNRADFWLIKGSAHLGAGQHELAESALASARELAPGNAQIAIQQAVLKQEKGDHASALQILGAIADRHPDVPEIFLNLGYSQQATGAERAAERSFRIFLRLTEGRSLYAGQRNAIQQWLAAGNPVR